MSDVKTLIPQKPARSSDPTVAIAFGGGGARGIAHIHVIETLDAMGIKPVAIAGSSIGAIMGATMASGLSGEEIRTHTLETVGKPGNAISRIWKADCVSASSMLSEFSKRSCPTPWRGILKI